MYTAYLAVMIPTYALKAAAGPRNFLWFSDIALFGTAVALWLENSLIVSTVAVGVLALELVWNADFFVHLFTGFRIVGLTDYMFRPKEPWYMKILSGLFHIFLPVVMVWTIWRLGYDSRALIAQTVLAWIVLPVTYLITDPRHNINWVFGFRSKPQQRTGPKQLFLLMLGMPPVIYLPSHLLLEAFFGR